MLKRDFRLKVCEDRQPKNRARAGTHRLGIEGAHGVGKRGDSGSPQRVAAANDGAQVAGILEPARHHQNEVGTRKDRLQVRRMQFERAQRFPGAPGFVKAGGTDGRERGRFPFPAAVAPADRGAGPTLFGSPARCGPRRANSDFTASSRICGPSVATQPSRVVPSASDRRKTLTRALVALARSRTRAWRCASPGIFIVSKNELNAKRGAESSLFHQERPGAA